MVIIYVSLIRKGLKTIEEVPPELKEEVLKILQ